MLASYHDVKKVYSVVLMSGCSRHFLSLCHEQHARLMMVAEDRQLRLRETHLVFPISLRIVTLFSRRPEQYVTEEGQKGDSQGTIHESSTLSGEASAQGTDRRQSALFKLHQAQGCRWFDWP